MTFSKILTKHKNRLSLSQKELAQILGVSPRKIWSWLNEPTEPGITEEGALARLERMQP
mgnify:CR=1 FL=1|tara:strand:+ start:338 stop:514 length:177 start_codon:yes stop_codon:yes gene_type:complete